MVWLHSRVFGPLKFDGGVDKKITKLALPLASKQLTVSIDGELGDDLKRLQTRVTWLDELAATDKAVRARMANEFKKPGKDKTVRDFLQAHIDEMEPAELRKALGVARTKVVTAADVLRNLLLRHISMWSADETVFDYGLDPRRSDQLLVAYFNAKGKFTHFSHES
jgi:hypothetical protein